MSGTSVAARLARREVVRRPWRSLVVLALIVFPVMFLTTLTVMVRTNERTWPERFGAGAGTEDLVIDDGRVMVDPETGAESDLAAVASDLIPEGSEILVFDVLSERIRTVDGHRTYGQLSTRPLHHPMSDGLLDRLQGRYPRTSDEALLTTRLARELKVGVGDTLELNRPADVTLTVVGIAERPGDLNEPVLFLGSDDDPEVLRSMGRGATARTLVDLPVESETDLAILAPVVDAGGQARHLPPGWQFDGTGAQVAIVWTWIGGAVAFTILGVVIAAAFAVTARRQLRLIGQLMGNGADDTTLRATLFLQGTVLGLVGAVIGVVAALVGLVVFQPVMETVIARRIAAYDMRVADLLPIIVIATVAATVAAVIPARTAVRTTVLQALAGRRPVGPYPARLVARGAVAAVGGLILLAVATAGAAASSRSMDGGDTTIFILTGIAGSIAVLLGTCAMAPALIARLEPLAGSLRGTARLAARSIARQRTRTGAVVAAIAVVAAGAVAGSTAWMTEEARSGDRYAWSMPGDLVVLDYREYLVSDTEDEAGEEWTLISTTAPPELITEVQSVVPDLRPITNRQAFARTDDTAAPIEARGESWFQIVDDEWAEAWEIGREGRDALADGHVVQHLWSSDYLSVDGTAETYTVIDEHGDVVAEVPTTIIVTPGETSIPMISLETAQDLGLTVVEGPATFRAAADFTSDQMDVLADLSDDLNYEYNAGWSPGDVSTSAYLMHPYESFEASRALITAAIIGAATILSLGVVALGLSLSAAETRDERDVLAAIGARPRALRRLAGAKAAVLSSTGTLIGIPLGFIPVVVVTRAASVDRFDAITPVFPWVQVVLLVIAVPVIASLATIAASAIALRLRPVTASTMAFD
ncbi:MAG: FtsX-like permease family protein [Acidimicrobiales bacterium]